jgi:hypothetical protein
MMTHIKIIAFFVFAAGWALFDYGIYLIAGAGAACIIASLPIIAAATIIIRGLIIQERSNEE